MITPNVVIVAACVAITALAFLMSGKFRLGQIVRYFSFQSAFLALLFAALAMTGDPHLYVSVVGVLVLKVVAIPLIILWTASHSGASGRLISLVRPAPSYFMAGFMLLLAVLAGRALGPQVANLDSTLVIVMVSALAVMLLGVAFLMMRRDLYSQIIGFLTLENGISMLGAAILGAIPFLIEAGIFFVITIGAVLMSLLSRRLKELYAVEDTFELIELVE